MRNRAHVGDGKMKRPTQQISKLKVNAHLGVLETAYSLYPNLTKDTAYGFLTRGCPRG